MSQAGAGNKQAIRAQFSIIDEDLDQQAAQYIIDDRQLLVSGEADRAIYEIYLSGNLNQRVEGSETDARHFAILQ